VAERLKAAVLKTVEGSLPPRVRIPASPPIHEQKHKEGNHLINIALVDDHNLVRTGIKHIFKDTADIKVIGEAENGEQALNLIKKFLPDIVLMDIKMPGPGPSGLLLLKELLRIEPELKIIILTSCDNKIFPVRMLKAGAMGYFLKDMNDSELIRAIHMVHAGQRYMPHEVATQLALQRTSGPEKPATSILSDREYKIMLALIKGQSVQEIAKELTLSHKTVNTYRYRLFDKLKVTNNVELTQFAIRNDLLDPQHDTEKTE
jgi:two-component system invasion response regulator UvrY